MRKQRDIDARQIDYFGRIIPLTGPLHSIYNLHPVSNTILGQHFFWMMGIASSTVMFGSNCISTTVSSIGCVGIKTCNVTRPLTIDGFRSSVSVMSIGKKSGQEYSSHSKMDDTDDWIYDLHDPPIATLYDAYQI